MVADKNSTSLKKIYLESVLYLNIKIAQTENQSCIRKEKCEDKV